MKIAFFGDIVGNTGINGVSDYIMDKSYDFIIVNGENANDTHGTTVDNYISIYCKEYADSCYESYRESIYQAGVI